MELMGFKSFADRTHIDFSSGISALLGPNGCGKSNIVDAVKWVLGEQSTKNMRAMKMEDVIFNGTVKRKALNVAEVTLTISNETNLLDLDAPEIEIKRRLYRNGDSDYFINGASVRLKELRELFFDTGIGKTAYSILEQGKIDQILSNRPEERRYLFEEAAGITKYKLKGQEAARKLERTRENIRQAQNILAEVSKSYFTLKEQAEKTESYRAIKDQLFDIEVNLQLLRIEKLKELHDRRGSEQDKKKASLKELESDIEKLNSDLGDSHKSQSKLKAQLADAQKEIYGIELERESGKSNITTLKEREREYNSQLERLSEREGKFSERSRELENEIKSKETEKSELEKSLKTLESNLEKSVKESTDLQSEIENIDTSVSALRKDIDVKEVERESYINKIKELATAITDIIEDRLASFNKAEFDLLTEHFRDQLKRAKTNSSILFNIEAEFDELLKILPVDIFTIIKEDKDVNKKRELDQKLKDLAGELDNIKDKIAKSTEKRSLLSHKLEVVNEIISTSKIKIAEDKVKITSVDDNITIIKKNLTDEEGVLSEIKKERAGLTEKLKQLVLDRDRYNKLLKELDEKEKKVKSSTQSHEKELDRLNKLNFKKEDDLNKKRENLSKISMQIERFNFEAEHMEIKVKELYEDFQEKYSLDLDDAASEIKEYSKDEDELKTHVHELRIKQKMIGQINLMAPEEFKEVSKRYNFLNDQIEDLKKADENLSTITTQIKDESTKLFRETFENIKKSFGIMYKRLFGGGEAELQLSDNSNILESGIEIFARPPGKSLENISLLSGGERSLTAVALLFATYSIKPSPFCILDEIDAALDERNISRFVETLTEFAKESQFIVITHNKKTVTGSGSLLGVTMQESGVSKLITMRLDHGEEEEG